MVALLSLPVALIFFHSMALCRGLIDHVSCPVSLMGNKIMSEMYHVFEVLVSLGMASGEFTILPNCSVRFSNRLSKTDH